LGGIIPIFKAMKKEVEVIIFTGWDRLARW